MQWQGLVKKRSEKDSYPQYPSLPRQLSYQLKLCTTAHIRTIRTRKDSDHLKHLLPPVSEQASGSGGYDAEPAPEGHGSLRCDYPGRSIGRIKTTGKRFNVVIPKDNTSPQQVHEDDLSPSVGFAGRT